MGFRVRRIRVWDLGLGRFGFQVLKRWLLRSILGESYSDLSGGILELGAPLV